VRFITALLAGIASLVGVVQAGATRIVRSAVAVRAPAVAALEALAVLHVAPFLTSLRRVMDLGPGRAGVSEQ
jgi:hypothetical protein